ncbi:MAG: type II toxin-antitoxin system RelE/ParE family toxin [Candidatus Margulisbacteria bacterium]|nr:type II toxin-antitoxin system RelE/ParE family toxin [Candidatus Margulisiibacteriota bacterium]
MTLISFKQTPLFRKTVKKLHKQDKLILDREIKVLIKNPKMGDLKTGDLSGVRVHKFKISKRLFLLGYVFAKNAITLLSFGRYENYYKKLKKYNS